MDITLTSGYLKIFSILGTVKRRYVGKKDSTSVFFYENIMTENYKFQTSKLQHFIELGQVYFKFTKLSFYSTQHVSITVCFTMNSSINFFSCFHFLGYFKYCVLIKKTKTFLKKKKKFLKLHRGNFVQWLCLYNVPLSKSLETILLREQHTLRVSYACISSTELKIYKYSKIHVM